MGQVEIGLERGDHYRLEKLHGKVLEAVAASGIDADVRRGASAGGMSVQGEPEMEVGGRRVARPEAMTARGMAGLLRMASEGEFDGSDGPLALPFDKRFRATGRAADVAGAAVSEVVDDATGVRYLLAGGLALPAASCGRLAAAGALSTREPDGRAERPRLRQTFRFF